MAAGCCTTDRASQFFGSIGFAPPPSGDKDPATYLLSLAATADWPSGDDLISPPSPDHMSGSVTFGASVHSVTDGDSESMTIDGKIAVDKGVGHTGKAVESLVDGSADMNISVRKFSTNSAGSDTCDHGYVSAPLSLDRTGGCVDDVGDIIGQLPRSNNRITFAAAPDAASVVVSPSTIARNSCNMFDIVRVFQASAEGQSSRQEAVNAVAEASNNERSSTDAGANDDRTDRRSMVWITMVLIHRQASTSAVQG